MLGYCVAHQTQGCGVADTALRHGYRRSGVWPVRDMRLRTLVLCLVAALAFHAPLVPSRMGALLRMFIRAQTEEPVPANQEVVLPIELDDDMLGGEASKQGGPEAAEPPEPAVALDDEPDGPGVRDAGARPPSSEPDGGVADAGPVDGGEPDGGAEDGDAGAELDAGPPDAGQAVAQAGDAGAAEVSGAGGKLEDPYAAAGAPGAVTPEHPNVRVYLAADRIRNQASGPLFSEMLVSIPEWNEVIGGTGIDPMRDFDHVLVSGPEFRNPDHIVAVLDYNIATPRIKRALEAAMAKSKPPGSWLEGHSMPVASLGDKGYRRAALLAQKHMLVLLPESAEDQIERLKDMQAFRKSGKASIVLYLLTPWRAFRGTGFPVPKRIKWLRLTLIGVDTAAGAAAGGYQLEVEGEDDSPEAAAEDAKELATAIEDVRVLPLIIKNVEIIGKPDFSVEGAMIHAKAEVSPDQVSRIVKYVKGWMKERVKEEAQQRGKRKPRIRMKTPSAKSSASASPG
jgi:hypothetical protein